MCIHIQRSILCVSLKLKHIPAPSSWVFYASFRYLSKQVICGWLLEHNISRIFLSSTSFPQLLLVFFHIKIKVFAFTCNPKGSADYYSPWSIFSYLCLFQIIFTFSSPVWLSALEVLIQGFLETYGTGMRFYFSIKYSNNKISKSNIVTSWYRNWKREIFSTPINWVNFCFASSHLQYMTQEKNPDVCLKSIITDIKRYINYYIPPIKLLLKYIYIYKNNIFTKKGLIIPVFQKAPYLCLTYFFFIIMNLENSGQQCEWTLLISQHLKGICTNDTRYVVNPN